MGLRFKFLWNTFFRNFLILSVVFVLLMTSGVSEVKVMCFCACTGIVLAFDFEMGELDYFDCILTLLQLSVSIQ